MNHGEQLTVDFEEDYQGTIMTKLADRKGKLLEMIPDGKGRVRLDYNIPTRGLIGFRTEYFICHIWYWFDLSYL